MIVYFIVMIPALIIIVIAAIMGIRARRGASEQAPPKPVSKPTPTPSAKPERQPEPEQTAPKSLMLWEESSQTPHGDKAWLEFHDGELQFIVANDGYPNRGGAGGRAEKVPQELLDDFTAGGFEAWFRTLDFWVAPFSVDENEVNRFLLQNGYIPQKLRPLLPSHIKQLDIHYDLLEYEAESEEMTESVYAASHHPFLEQFTDAEQLPDCARAIFATLHDQRYLLFKVKDDLLITRAHFGTMNLCEMPDGIFYSADEPGSQHDGLGYWENRWELTKTEESITDLKTGDCGGVRLPRCDGCELRDDGILLLKNPFGLRGVFAYHYLNVQEYISSPADKQEIGVEPLH